ncbi:MAG: GNAT family N-acetyltransferase [Xanthobacteraceae bacterium]|nr:GNAT family N-acetyltransferase [Xanthobacteraceae bacterium]
MDELSRNFQSGLAAHRSAVEVMSGDEVGRCRRWLHAFATQRKDSRYYEIVSRDIRQGFDYRYFALRDAGGEVRALAPFFVLDQDLCAAIAGARPALAALRRLWPRFMTARTLMVGCAAGEGHLDCEDEMSHAEQVRLLRDWIGFHADRLGARLVVFKEFPAKYRGVLGALCEAGYTRVPSFPMTRLDIDYPSFEAYMARALSRKTRRDLRLKFRAAAAASISLAVTSDITDRVDEVYPLYLQVFARSKWRFEKLTPEFLCELGRQMPDKVRYFVWSAEGKAIAFSLCMVDGEDIFAEYLGLDYSRALDLHLYHYAFRDVVRWAMANGYKRFRSSGLNYEPKLHLCSELEPLDLYVRHASPLVNKVLARVLPVLEPTHADPILRRFPNYDEIWA